jgi:RNA polymerase sigma factor (sigma-70 family)
MLTAIASGLVGHADADDIVQETFLRALTRPPRDTNAPVAPWLAAVARNLSLDLLRTRGRFVELSDDERSVPSPAPADLRGPALLAGLGQLTEGEVAALLLRDWLDLDVDDVATALDTSAGSVRVLHHRARKKAAVAAPLDQTARAVDRFLTWLLNRANQGLPVVGQRAYDPVLTQGVLVAYLALLDAMIELAQRSGDRGVEGNARL